MYINCMAQFGKMANWFYCSIYDISISDCYRFMGSDKKRTCQICGAEAKLKENSACHTAS